MNFQNGGFGKQGGAKKSTYVFLCSILGILLFLLVHRLLFFFYLILISANPQIFSRGLNSLEISAIDFFTLILALFGGMWYGIWLGLRWYEAVYEKNTHNGFIGHLISSYWPNPARSYDLQAKMQSVTDELAQDVLELESISKTIKPVLRAARPVKRRIVRKKAGAVKKAGA